MSGRLFSRAVLRYTLQCYAVQYPALRSSCLAYAIHTLPLVDSGLSLSSAQTVSHPQAAKGAAMYGANASPTARGDGLESSPGRHRSSQRVINELLQPALTQRSSFRLTVHIAQKE